MDTNKKEVFGQLEDNGCVRVAFVGTLAELEAQITKEYDAVVVKIKDAIKKYEEELSKLKNVDFSNLTEQNVEEAAKFVHFTKMLLKTKKELANFKKPAVADGTYFVLNCIGKLPQLEDK